MVCIFYWHMPLEINEQRPLHPDALPALPLLLPVPQSPTEILLPPRANHMWADQASRPRYDLDYLSLSKTTQESQRRIRENDASLYHDERRKELQRLVEATPSEEESSSGVYFDHYEEQTFPEKNDCYRLKWTYELHPTCNAFHEFHMFRHEDRLDQHYNMSYISRGHFRDTWLVVDDHDDYVLKTNRPARDISAYPMTQMQVEALMMERTTWSHRTMALFGHCGVSVIVERGVPVRRKIIPRYRHISKQDLAEEWKDGVKPFNEETSLGEKLDIAIAMAESLAVIHGHEEGVMLDNDLSLFQWLYDKKGHLKLNDFNKGKFVRWNPVKQTYCGVWVRQKEEHRSPEEMKGAMVDELAETHSFGKILFSLLTGLKPYFWVKGNKFDIKDVALAGELPPIDDRFRNRSLVEGRLAELIPKLYAYKREDRESIFYALAHLRETRRLFDEAKKSSSSLQH